MTTIEIKKGEIYEYRGNRGSWGDLPSVVGTLGMITVAESYEIKCSCIGNGNGFVDTMVRDGTFVKVAEADGTPVEPVKEPGAPEDWVEKERVRLGLDDLPEVLKDENGFTELLRIDTWEDWVGFSLGDGYPAHITGGQLGKGDLDKVIIALLYVRDHLKKAGYDF